MIGFCYVARHESALSRAAVGERVRNAERGPPWIVVTHDLSRAIVSRWPGRLLRVAVRDAATAADGAPPLVPDAGYTRAVEVEVLEELSPWLLFGPHGEGVVAVVEAAGALTHTGAATLAGAIAQGAQAAYSVAWDAWLRREEREGSIHFGRDHDDTLAIPARGRPGSPIAGGLSLVYGELRRRALEVDGPAAEHVDAEGESSLVAPWSDASTALLHAAMALGAPDLVDAEARARLLAAWSALGAAPPT